MYHYFFPTKDDYMALLDKLACPKCKTEQSFDEYHEKIRECRRCKEKFVKLKVCNVLAFERQQKEQEEKRQKKLLELEEAMYGSVGKMASKSNDRQRHQLGQSRAATAASSVTAVPVRTQNIHGHMFVFVYSIFVYFFGLPSYDFLSYSFCKLIVVVFSMLCCR